MSYHNILSKTDRALAAYLIAQGAGTSPDVLPAKASLDKAAPCTVCFSERATLINPNTGLYDVTVAVMVKTIGAIDTDQADGTPKEDSEERVAKTFDALFAGLDDATDKLADALTLAARASADNDLEDFTAIAVQVHSVEAGFEPKGSVWIDTINLVVTCCPRDVS